jgi:hypothetical protein
MLAPMNEATFVHLISDETPPGLADALAGASLTGYTEIHLEPDPARTCQKIATSTFAKTLIIIATGNACSQLPAVALARRASGKTILRYELVEPNLPRFTDSWPQSPITAYFSVGSTIPRDLTLRGINVAEFEDVDALAQFIRNSLL